jgi:RHS repeat-associated protein
MRPLRPYLRFALFTTLVLAFASVARAQGVNLGNGFTPYGSYDSTTIDHVNLMNGNVTLHVPLPFSYPQRGGKLNSPYYIVDNSKGWAVQAMSTPVSGFIYFWGYTGSTGNYSYADTYAGAYFATPLLNLSLLRTYTTTLNPGSQTTAGVGNYVFYTWDGATHNLGQSAGGEGNPTGLITSDTTGYQITLTNPDTYGIPTTATIVDRNGNVYQGTFSAHGVCTSVKGSGVGAETTITCNQSLVPTSVTDSNGNKYGLSSLDTIGRTLPLANSSTASSTSGCVSSLPLSSATLFNYTGPDGAAETLELCYGTLTYNTEFGQSGVDEVQNSPASQSKTTPVIVTAILANGTKYTFNWDGYANITSIGLPTGGSISYVWTEISIPSALTLPCPVGNLSLVTRALASRTISDGVHSSTWSYTWGTQQSNGTVTNIATDPLGNSTVHVFAPVNSTCGLYETGTTYYQGSNTSGQVLKSVITAYSGSGWSAVAPTSIQTTVGSQVSLVQKTYDTGTNFPVFADVVTELDYDWGASPHGSLLKQTNTSYLWQTNSTYETAGLVNLPSSVVVENAAGTRVAETDYTYDESAYLTASSITTSHVSPIEGVRGNPSTVSKWLNTGAAVVSHTNWYDTGEPYQKIDPKGNKTTYAYSSTYAGAYPTTITNALNQVTTNVYDFSTGLLTSTTDPNSQTSSFSYDEMFRKTQDTYPDGGQTSYCYTDIGGATCSKSVAPFDLVVTEKITSSVNLTETAVSDGLGRLVQTQLNSDPSGIVYVDTTYDADGRKYTVSNPYRTKTDPTYGITSTVYDALGRPCVVIPPDGTSVANTSCPATQPSNDVFTTYSGNTTTVTDQQGKSRKSQTDGLGRLTNVWEDPAGVDYLTVYSYDSLGDLLTVVQGGSHNRTFVYDSLKRLTSSTNPETGTVTYTYDPDSNVATKLDARAFTITYAYDALNRMTGKTYSNGDHAITYTYDQTGCLGLSACYNVGRRTGMTDAAGSESWAYDKMGRELAEQRTSNSITKSTAYTYNLDGSLATLTYPSGRIITYATNAAAQPISALDVADSINYAQAGAYAPQGALSALTLGAAGSFAGISISNTYNPRLEPNELKASSTAGTAMDLSYTFVDASSHNNGNVIQITNNKDTTRTQQFTYDTLNRVITAKTASTTGTNCWGQNFGYDQWANLTSTTVSQCTAPGLSMAMSASNQFTTTGFSYDASGNVLADGTNTYAWNAESQIKTATGVNYTYDGDGDRVQKSNGKIYWYGAGSEILDESDLSGNITDEHIFFGGKRIAHRVVSGNAIYYYAEDFLGSSRVMTTSTGTVCYDADFYPYGGERVVTNTCPQNYKFTGKERDAETSNDDFGARYYSSQFGRWTSPDWSAIPAPVPYANLTNPQTLNLYAMVRDNPETFADLDGHDGMVQAGKVTVGGQPENPTVAKQSQEPNTPQPPPQDQQGSATARATEAGESALNFTLAKVKLDAALATAATSETGVGAVATAYAAISAAGSFAAGSIQAIGVATGHTKSTETAAEVIATVTSILGLGTLVATGGNLNKAATAAAAEGIVTSNPKDLASGGTVARAAKAMELGQNIHSVGQAIKNWFSSGAASPNRQ